MERITFVPDQMDRAATMLRNAADQLGAGSGRVRTAAACCCAPAEIAGWVSQAAGSVASRVDSLADGLRTDGAELAQRAELARTGQDPNGELVGGSAVGATTGGAPVDPIVAAAIVVVHSLLVQLIASHTAGGAVAPTTAVIGGTGGPGYTIVAGDGSVVTGGVGALLGNSVVGGTSSGFTSGVPAPTIGTVGGGGGLGMTITPGGPTSTADISAALAGAGGTIGGSWSPEYGLGPQYADPGQAARLAAFDALLNAPMRPVTFDGSAGPDAITSAFIRTHQETIRFDTNSSNPNVPSYNSSIHGSQTDYEREYGLRG